MNRKELVGLAISAARGALIGAALSLLLSMLGGVLTVRGVIGVEYWSVMAVCCAALAAFAAALTVGRKTAWRLGRLLVAAVMLLILLLIHALAFESAPYHLPAMLLALFGAAGLSCILPGGGRRARRKYR